MGKLFSLADVVKTYQMGDVEVRALRGVSLEVDEGDFLVVMGSSGSGKSTLMNLLGCLDRPTSGSYHLAGGEMSRLNRAQLAHVRNRTLGFVFQSFNLLSRTSALENVELPMLYAGIHSKERRRRAQEALTQVGLKDRMHHSPNQLSGGQQQRVAIARAIVNRPRMILADEPTGNLDSRTSVEVMALFQELGKSGMTVVLVTHESDVSTFGSRLIDMKDGRIRSDKRQTPAVARPELIPLGSRGSRMTLFQTVRVAGRALFRNKMRSFLTTLGIVIGVGAVIAMVGLGEGAKARVEQTFAAMGTNLLVIMPGTSSAGGAHGGFGSMPTLTWADLDAISNEVSGVRVAAAVLRTSTSILSDSQNWTTSVQGTTPAYLEIRSWKLSQGNAFTDSDVESGNKVVLLGATVVEKLFGAGANPVNETVRIKNVPFMVVGVLAKKGQSPMGQDYDDVALIPSTTFRSKMESGLGNYINGIIYVSALSADATPEVERLVTELLRDRHHLAASAESDFSLRNLSEIASASQEGAQTLTTLLAGIAAVSLLVGGIGIMNIMLVSVTERTREIGLRIAVGATPNQVLSQFLVEALTLALLGGLVGVCIGAGGAVVLAQYLGWPVLVRPDVVVVSLGFSGGVGVVFGLYPALKASRLDPIDALRYE